MNSMGGLGPHEGINSLCEGINSLCIDSVVSLAKSAINNINNNNNNNEVIDLKSATGKIRTRIFDSSGNKLEGNTSPGVTANESAAQATAPPPGRHMVGDFKVDVIPRHAEEHQQQQKHLGGDVFSEAGEDGKDFIKSLTFADLAAGAVPGTGALCVENGPSSKENGDFKKLENEASSSINDDGSPSSNLWQDRDWQKHHQRPQGKLEEPPTMATDAGAEAEELRQTCQQQQQQQPASLPMFFGQHFPQLHHHHHQQQQHHHHSGFGVFPSGKYHSDLLQWRETGGYASSSSSGPFQGHHRYVGGTDNLFGHGMGAVPFWRPGGYPVSGPSSCLSRESSRDDLASMEGHIFEYEERFRVDRRKLELMMIGRYEQVKETALDFFQRVGEETNSTVIWPSRLKIGAKSKKDPYIKVGGQEEGVKRAKSLIMEHLDTKTNRVTMKMDVSYTDHSHVIGKGGNTIRRVMSETGCHIHFPDSNRSNPNEKSNQVSIAGEIEGVEKARARVRELTPLLFTFDLPIVPSLNPVLDPNDQYLRAIQDQFNIQVMFRQKQKNFPTTVVVVKGCEWEAARVKEATLLLVDHLCGLYSLQGAQHHQPSTSPTSLGPRSERGFGGDTSPPGGKRSDCQGIPISMAMEISPVHHSVVLGKGNMSLRTIMQRTKTTILFPDAGDPNIPSIRKGSVTITGSIHNVYFARQMLLGSLPLVMMFEMPDNIEMMDDNGIQKLQEDLDICISIKPKQRQSNKSVLIKAQERNASSIYRARHILLRLGGVPIVANIPNTYYIVTGGPYEHQVASEASSAGLNHCGGDVGISLAQGLEILGLSSSAGSGGSSSASANAAKRGGSNSALTMGPQNQGSIQKVPFNAQAHHHLQLMCSGSGDQLMTPPLSRGAPTFGSPGFCGVQPYQTQAQCGLTPGLPGKQIAYNGSGSSGKRFLNDPGTGHRVQPQQQQHQQHLHNPDVTQRSQTPMRSGFQIGYPLHSLFGGGTPCSGMGTSSNVASAASASSNCNAQSSPFQALSQFPFVANTPPPPLVSTCPSGNAAAAGTSSPAPFWAASNTPGSQLPTDMSAQTNFLSLFGHSLPPNHPYLQDYALLVLRNITRLQQQQQQQQQLQLQQQDQHQKQHQVKDRKVSSSAEDVGNNNYLTGGSGNNVWNEDRMPLMASPPRSRASPRNSSPVHDGGNLTNQLDQLDLTQTHERSCNSIGGVGAGGAGSDVHEHLGELSRMPRQSTSSMTGSHLGPYTSCAMDQPNTVSEKPQTGDFCQFPTLRKLDRQRYNPDDEDDIDAVDHLNTLPKNDWRAPGREKKSLEIAGLGEYDQKRLLAAKALQSKPLAGEPRTPTSTWSGLGFSNSMPECVIRERLAAEEEAEKRVAANKKYNNSSPFNSEAKQPPSHGLNINPLPPGRAAAPQSRVSPRDKCGQSGTDQSGGGGAASSVWFANSSALDSLLNPKTLLSGDGTFDDDLPSLFAKQGLAKYTDLFLRHEIDIQTFATLTEQDLKEIGIQTFGARKKLLLLANKVKQILTSQSCDGHRW